MAAKAYVSSMTVAELTSELKKRGLNARGKKKVLQARLEEVYTSCYGRVSFTKPISLGGPGCKLTFIDRFLGALR